MNRRWNVDVRNENRFVPIETDEIEGNESDEKVEMKKLVDIFPIKD